MKQTAILHAGFTVAVVAGLTVLTGMARLAAFGFGAVLFVAGVVTARVSDD